VTSTFDLITDEFVDNLDAIRSVVETFSKPEQPRKARVAAANSATLLVAATFEEFVREMAREYARSVVRATNSFEKLPDKLASTAWKRTMDGLSRIKFENHSSRGEIFAAAQSRFSLIFDFCKGDLTKEIYNDLIHNESNMRPAQINELFKVAGLKDVCKKCSDKQALIDLIGEAQPDKIHGRLITMLNDFFERRNEIAHALRPLKSSSPQQIETDIDMLECFGESLRETLKSLAPLPLVPTS